jgi:hypothetical protein
MKRSRLSAALYLLLVFVSGVLVGGFGYRLYTMSSVRAGPPERRSPEDYRKKYVSELRSRLKLDDDQVRQLEIIMDDTGQRFRELRERTEPQVKAIEKEQKAIQEQHRDKVQAMLRPDQTAEYQKMLVEREKRRSRSDGRGRGR